MRTLLNPGGHLYSEVDIMLDYGPKSEPWTRILGQLKKPP